MRHRLARLLVLSVKLGSASSAGLGEDLFVVQKLDASREFPKATSIAAAPGRDYRGACMHANTTINRTISSLLPEIRRIAQRLDWKNFDDVTQDVALKLLKARPNQRQLQHTGWLSSVVRNTVRDRSRMEHREAQYLDRSVGLDLSGSVCAGLDEHKWYVPQPLDPKSMEDYLIPIVREKLQQLPKEQRQAFVLHVAGYSYVEIGDITGTSVGTVRSRIHYARKGAQKLLTPVIG
jgi:RNA polymerase sigma-70 factor (ECF subfamily)